MRHGYLQTVPLLEAGRCLQRASEPGQNLEYIQPSAKGRRDSYCGASSDASGWSDTSTEWQQCGRAAKRK